ncbi:acyl carrier protein [Kangiella sp.]|uniref:acyl carrier protein n=1 Tax=Kangiella sp. TaxID=1920245 RepID=UPI0019AE59D6|nr:acyl carrier protein [Kangiella sp.]MBD3653185.1 acyl carrier protein [Kangiella sp.]
MAYQTNIDKMIALLSDTLSIDADQLTADTLLLGNLPEFDSMAIVSILMQIEENFGIEISDDELTGEVFESVATLTEFVEVQQAATAI